MSILDPPKPRRASRLVIGLIAAAVLLSGGAIFAKVYLLRPFSPLDTPEGKALGRSVSTFQVEEQANLRHGGAPEVQKQAASSVLDPKAREALGPDVVGRLETLLRTLVDVEAAQDPPSELRNRFEQEGILLNQALSARGLPYFIDASLIHTGRSTMPILYSYYIERRDELSSGDRELRALFVRRLDDLNFKNAAVGYTKPSVDAALILLDDVESELIEFILPAVAAGEDTLLLDLDSIDAESDWQKDLRARSAEIVKSAFARVTGAKTTEVEELGALFYRRRKLVRGWMKSLAEQRFKLFIPRRLIPEADYANELVGRIPLTELREWRAIHERLMEGEMLQAFDAIVVEQARSVEHHEAQHRLDYDRDKIIVPKAVAETLGLRKADDAFDDEFALYVSGEVSAYLAEIARGPGHPALGIMALSQSAFNRREWGGAYCYAALVVISGLSKELGVGEGVPIVQYQIDRPALTKRFMAVTGKPEQEIRDAARRLWEAWYEAKLPDIRLENSDIRPAWRH